MSGSMVHKKGRDLAWASFGVILLTLGFTACGSSDSTWRSSPNSPSPSVTATTPLDVATNVALNTKPTAVFDMAMGPLTPTTFTLYQGTTPVPGSVTTSADGLTATFSPSSNLMPSTVFTATITTGAMSMAGGAVMANHMWRFTTTAAAAAIAPVVTSTTPVANATGVALGSNVAAIFSKAMDPLTLTTTTFTLKQGSTPVVGSVTQGSGTTATFTPTSPLTASTVYTATLSTGIKDMQGNALATTSVWSFTTSAVVVTPPAPSVSSTSPVDAATNVALSAKPSALFDMAMSPLSATTFTLNQGTTLVPGSVATSADGMTATFAPSSALTPNSVFTATVTTGAMSMAGGVLMAKHTWSFTTTAAVVAPLVSSTSPAAGATGVTLNSKVSASFSKAMDPLTLTTTTFTLKQGSTPVVGSVTLGSGTSATFTPTSPLTASTLYTATLSTGAKDVQGNALTAAFVWNFTTGAVVDTTPPVVNSTIPVNSATGVAVNSMVAATFSKAMDPTTISSTNFTLKQGVMPVMGNVAYAAGSNTATFTPTSPLVAGTLYTAALTTAVKDMQGNALALAFGWSFTVGTAVAIGPAPVDLGMAGNYVILAKTGISTVPTSAITGDIAVSPAAATYLTGFALTADATNVFSTSTQIVGKAFAANYAVPTPSNLTTAVSNMEAAYIDAEGRITPDFLELGTGNIGGLTLAPGLYKWTSTVTIPTNVTISGGANDTWIFQTTGDLLMSPATKVILGGDAQAKNIVWQVAGQTTIGTGAHFEGILLDKTQVTVQTGASMNGRILAQTQVALQQAAVTKP